MTFLIFFSKINFNNWSSCREQYISMYFNFRAHHHIGAGISHITSHARDNQENCKYFTGWNKTGIILVSLYFLFFSLPWYWVCVCACVCVWFLRSCVFPLNFSHTKWVIRPSPHFAAVFCCCILCETYAYINTITNITRHYNIAFAETIFFSISRFFFLWGVVFRYTNPVRRYPYCRFHFCRIWASVWFLATVCHRLHCCLSTCMAWLHLRILLRIIFPILLHHHLHL